MNRALALIKHIFWPHHGNEFQPALIRVRGLIVVLLAVTVIGSASSFTGSDSFHVLGYATDVTVGGLLEETNEERTKAGLPGYLYNEELSLAATNKALHMIDNDYWSHVAPDGTTPWEFLDDVNYLYIKAGENLAYGFSTSSGTVAGWMDSPGHKANILDQDFAEVGFGFINGVNYQGTENTVVVAMYARPFIAPSIVFEEEEEPEELTPIASTSPDNNSPSGSQTTRDSTRYPISSDAETTTIGAQVTSVYRALLRGDAPLSMYIVIGLLMLVGLVYALRHIRVVHRFIVVGEHAVAGHPMLEASLVYVLIWLILTATFGVII